MADIGCYADDGVIPNGGEEAVVNRSDDNGLTENGDIFADADPSGMPHEEVVSSLFHIKDALTSNNRSRIDERSVPNDHFILNDGIFSNGHTISDSCPFRYPGAFMNLTIHPHSIFNRQRIGMMLHQPVV